MYGLFSLSFMALNLAKTLAVFGFDVTLLRYGAEAISKRSDGELKDVYLKCLGFTLSASVLLALGLFLGAQVISEWVFHAPELTGYIQVTALCLVPYTLLSLNAELIKASGNSVLYMLVNEGAYFGIAVVTIQVLSYYLNIPNIMVGFTIAIVLLMCYSFFWIIKRLNWLGVERIETYSFEKLFHTSLSFLLAGSSVFIKNWSDIFLLGVFASPREVGIYSVVFKISKTITIPVTTINSIQAPLFSSLFGQGKLKELADYVRLTNKQIVLLSLPAVVIIMVLPSFLIQLFGDDFIEGTTALVVLALGFLFKAIAGSTSLLLQMTNHEKRFMQIAIVSLLFGLAMNVVLIPHYGVLGAAITSTIVHLFWNGLCAYYSSKELGFNTVSIRK